MNEFKIGDIITGLPHNGYHVTNENMIKAKVLSTFNNNMEIEVLEHKVCDKVGHTYVVDNTSKSFKKIISDNLTKQELLDMPLGTKITTDQEKNNIYTRYAKNFFKNDLANCIAGYDINDDLTLADKTYGTKIIKVEKPTYETIYEHQEPKEMTVAEIEKALGYGVKIIKEDK